MRCFKNYKYYLYLLKKDLFNKKNISAFILLFIFLHMILSGLNDFSSYVNEKVNPLIFSLYFEDSYTKLLIYIPFIILVSDTSDIKKEDINFIIRTNRINWINYKLLYIICSNILFFSLIQLFSILIIFKNSKFGLEWGPALETLFKTNAQSTFEIYLGFNRKIFDYFTISQSFFYSLIINILVGILASLIILFLNNIFKSKIIGSFFIITTLLFENMNGVPYIIRYFNIMSWNSLGKLEYENIVFSSFSYYYVLILSVILIIILYILNRQTFKKINIL